MHPEYFCSGDLNNEVKLQVWKHQCESHLKNWQVLWRDCPVFEHVYCFLLQTFPAAAQSSSLQHPILRKRMFRYKISNGLLDHQTNHLESVVRCALQTMRNLLASILGCRREFCLFYGDFLHNFQAGCPSNLFLSTVLVMLS